MKTAHTVLFALLITASACALDLPITPHFRIGQSIHVVPGPKDLSMEMGLVVTADTIRTGGNHLSIGGTVYNYSDRRYDAVALSFAVTSYQGIGVMRGFAKVEPDTLLPGGMGRFVCHIATDGARPRLARFTVSASPGGSPSF